VGGCVEDTTGGRGSGGVAPAPAEMSFEETWDKKGGMHWLPAGGPSRALRRKFISRGRVAKRIGSIDSSPQV